MEEFASFTCFLRPFLFLPFQTQNQQTKTKTTTKTKEIMATPRRLVLPPNMMGAFRGGAPGGKPKPLSKILFEKYDKGLFFIDFYFLLISLFYLFIIFFFFFFFLLLSYPNPLPQ